ncbi:HlyD family secretion protein [Thalassospira alkalitolerans]|uniref:Secretion protein HlyD n=1 Tax=Thalassospira alkalitolerans TaxID=1293890 RepID=A0A1Y2LER5_9PROT|nr:HlyD family secretion protein [Thalassospira alkalitolerans]OSQ49066.1 secretion protein HlyD [Thalassospira alkalitolerans]|tara:strand:- start:5214 stop:6107 length:894 start_codon:yes stop_codon:yes gene_type:complete
MKPTFANFLRVLVTLVLVLAASAGGYQLYDYYMNAPWTRDGRISADVVAIAPDVSGLVHDVQVTDNQLVHAGDLLFTIDPARYQVAVDQAQAKLETAIAARDQAKREVKRYQGLDSDVVSRQKKEQVKTSLATAKAAVDLAQADLALAMIDLSRTKVVAPVDGIMTNFSLRRGNYVGAGQAIAALVDSQSFYVAGYFEETKLPRIAIGDPVEIRLMGEENAIYGHVVSIASGIQDSERTGTGGNLANVKSTFSWVRLAQRVPVRVSIDDVPDGVLLVAGRSATVTVLGAKGLTFLGL